MARYALRSETRSSALRASRALVAVGLAAVGWVWMGLPRAASADISCASVELDQKIVAPRGGPTDQFGHAVAISGDLAVVGARYEADASGIRSGAAYVFLRTGTTWALEARLQAADALADDFFGSSVAISGDTVVVGAPGDDEAPGSGTGAAYVFTRTLAGPTATWTQTVKLVDAAPTASDEFGRSIAISGDYAVIGSPGDDDLASGAGAAHVFTRVAGVWSFASKLTASDGASGDAFGSSVSIDGSSIAVGAPLDNNGLTSDEGSAYVFVSTGPATFSQQAKIAPTSSLEAGDQFGYAVVIDGDTLACGVPFDDQGLFPSTADVGRVFVYTRTGTTWTQRAQLTEAVPDEDRRFGGALALDGDTLVIGTPTDNLPSNFVSVFVRTGGLTGSWAEQTTLSNPGGPAAYFGVAVAISGETLFAGARGDGTGRFLGCGLARVYTRAGGPTGTWSQQAVLGEFDDLSAANDDLSRDIASDGEWLVIGCPDDDNYNGVDAGSVYVYRYEGGNWVFWTRLYASDGQAGDRFGRSVSVGTDTIAIGASADDDRSLNGGSVYVYTLTSDTWIIQQKILPSTAQFAGSFGSSVSLSGDTLAIGAPQSVGALPSGTHGVVQVFTRSGTVWSLQASLDPGGLTTADSFGGKVVLVGDLLAIAATNADAMSAIDAGAVYFYQRSAGVWTLAQTLRAPVPEVQAQFGYDVELRADRVVIGENFRKINDVFLRGAVHTFSRVGSAPWVFESTISPAIPDSGSGFGAALAMAGDFLCVGFDGSSGVPLPMVPDSGEVRLYGYSTGGTWIEVRRFRPPTSTVNQSFGDAFALVGDQLIVGATGDQAAGGLRSGAAYVYTLSRLDTDSTITISADPACENEPVVFSSEFGESLGVSIQWQYTPDAVTYHPVLDGVNTFGYLTFTASGATTEELTITPSPLWPRPRMGSFRAQYSLSCATAESPSEELVAIGPCCTIAIDPRATYLRQDPVASSSVAHPLASCGLSPGTRVRIEQLGEYEYIGPNAATRTEAGVVFSSTNQLLTPENLVRVPGAVAVPGVNNFASLPTLFSGLPTDIPEDIRLPTSPFDIPANAQYVFVTPNDDLFTDNYDTDGDYALRFVVVDGATVSSPPIAVYACGSGAVSFTIGASPGGPILYTWGFDADPPSTVFVELNNDGPYIVGDFNETKFNLTGGGTSTIMLTPGTGGRWRDSNNGRVRCRVFNIYGNETSIPVQLTVCGADFNCSHSVDVVDLFDFLDTWFMQNGLMPPAPPAGNADHDGDGDVDVVDLFDFLDSWFAQNGVCG